MGWRKVGALWRAQGQRRVGLLGMQDVPPRQSPGCAGNPCLTRVDWGVARNGPTVRTPPRRWAPSRPSCRPPAPVPQTGGASVLETLSPPRVALLFLTRRDVPNEVAWRELLGADAEPAPEPAGAGDDAGLSTDAAALPWQVLFALHTHPEPGWEFPDGSLFHGTEVPGRGQVQWGRHSMMTAEKRLLAAALADPRSQRFAFFSESCIPLWPRHTLYFALMAESRSNLDAHAKPNVKTHQHYHMTYRRVLGWICGLLL